MKQPHFTSLPILDNYLAIFVKSLRINNKREEKKIKVNAEISVGSIKVYFAGEFTVEIFDKKSTIANGL